MRLEFVARIKSAVVVASPLFLIGPSLGLAQEREDPPPTAKQEAPRKEIASGVIVKVEKLPTTQAKGAGETTAPRLRLSINPNAVWRDWARDQARTRDQGTPKQDAAKGAKSIATTGQPVDADNLVVIEIAASTKVETRFRSPNDETSKGETTPEKVKSDEGTTTKTPARGKPVQFRAEDLAAGLFVEAEFRPTDPEKKDDVATIVTVIRPIEVSETPPAAASPK
ncbi:hypothetical protein [Paludisphaera soli]|uniref:hypothetical protein n=1 Tax=Paludisphaera soli TaxID=2712865 RepID=UPI0013EA4E55|nr:hypothetical protein [Paludisphaera soli]